MVGLTCSRKNLVKSYGYDPYGIMLHQTEGVSHPWKFAGGFLDSSTSLYKFGTRYYDPTLGRWTQQDPVGGSLGSPDSLNRYLYAKDNPVNFTDPSGKDTISDFLACMNSCLSSQGLVDLVAGLIVAVCGIVCLGGLGVGCILCILAPFAVLGFVAGYCTSRCTGGS